MVESILAVTVGWGKEVVLTLLTSKKKKKAVTVYEKLILNDREQSQQIPTSLKLWRLSSDI